MAALVMMMMMYEVLLEGVSLEAKKYLSLMSMQWGSNPDRGSESDEA